VFRSSRGSPRHSGREPPAKQPRLSTDTGFNALSDFKKCQLLTIANVPTADFLNSNLKALLELDKSDRLRWFNANIMPLLKQRDMEAFADFEYTAECLDRLCDVALTSTNSDNWWESLLGDQMYRSKADVQHLNRLHRSRGDQQLQLQIAPSQLGTLQSKAPVPITAMSELLLFLKRARHFSTLFSQCATWESSPGRSTRPSWSSAAPSKPTPPG